MTIVNFETKARAKVRAIVLDVLSEREPLTAHEIAHFASGSFSWVVTSSEARQAINELRGCGFDIAEHHDGVQVVYWLRDGGIAA